MTAAIAEAVTCSASSECVNAPKYANGDCGTHYARRQKYGSPFGMSVAREMFPVEPLARFVRGLELEPVEKLTEALGERFISAVRADEIACKILRVHPSAVWPNWFEVQQAS